MHPCCSVHELSELSGATAKCTEQSRPVPTGTHSSLHWTIPTAPQAPSETPHTGRGTGVPVQTAGWLGTRVAVPVQLLQAGAGVAIPVHVASLAGIVSAVPVHVSHGSPASSTGKGVEVPPHIAGVSLNRVALPVQWSSREQSCHVPGGSERWPVAPCASTLGAASG